MVLIGFNYLETPGKQISLFERGRQENDGGKEKTGWFTCLNSKVKKKKNLASLAVSEENTENRKDLLSSANGSICTHKHFTKKTVG